MLRCCKLEPSTWEEFVIVCHTKEEGEVIADVAALRVHEYVPAGARAGSATVRQEQANCFMFLLSPQVTYHL